METPGHGGRGSGTEVLPSLKQKAFPPRPRAVLEGMLGTASTALELGVTATLNEVEQQLFKLAEQARSNEAQNRCFEALREIRRGRADVMPRFLMRLEAALATFVETASAPTFARLSRTQREQLSLVDPAEFEESLALQEVASKAEIRYSQALFALGQRFGVLAGAPAFEADELPVGPHRLCECLRHAVACLDIELENRVLIYRMFDRQCMSLMGSLYDQINEVCIRNRVLPNLQFQAKVRRPETAATSSAGSPPPAAPGAPAAAAPTHPSTPAAHHPQPFGGGMADSGMALGVVDAPSRRSGPARHPAGLATEPLPTAGTPSPGGAHAGSAAAPVTESQAGSRVESPSDPFTHPMTGWPGTPVYHPDHGGETDARDLEVFETMRDLLAGRRVALGQNMPPPPGSVTVRSEDVQAVLGAIQSKPAPPMMIGGKLVTRSVQHLKQDVLNQLREVTPEGKAPRLSEQDADTIDLVGMLFEHLTRDVKPDSTVQDLMTRLQIPLLRVALRDKSFFTRRAHPARQLLNAVAEAGLFWLDDESDDRALVEKMRLVVDRVTQEYDESTDIFDDLLGDLSKHLGTLARKSEVAERRHVDAAKGREKLDLARSTAAQAVADRLRGKRPSALIRTLLEQAWTDVLALTLLRQGEGSETYARRLAVADRLVAAFGAGEAAIDGTEAQALRQDVETGLHQVGYHGDDVQTVVNRLFGGAAHAEDPTTLTELALKLKARSRLGEDTAESGAKPTVRGKIHPPLTADEQRIAERLRTVPFGTWFEFTVNQQGDRVRRKLSWFSTVTGRCLFVNQRGARTDEKSLEQLARDIGRGAARVVEAQKESMIDRAWSAIVSTLRSFTGRAPAAEQRPA